MTAHSTANAAYTIALTLVENRLRDLNTEIESHTASHQANPKNWCLVGDAQRVNEVLCQIAGFLSNEDDERQPKRVTAQKAGEAYAEAATIREEYLREITQLIADHKTDQAAHTREWGFAGDMNYIAEQLHDAIRVIRY